MIKMTMAWLQTIFRGTPCPECGTRFSTGGGLSRHRRRNHGAGAGGTPTATVGEVNGAAVEVNEPRITLAWRQARGRFVAGGPH